MNNVRSNMVWLPRENYTEDQIQQFKKQLTIIGKSRGLGDRPICKTYSENGKWLGIPRAYGADFPAEDQTAFPRLKWPELKFPTGGGWREGQYYAVNDCIKQIQSGVHEGRLEAKCGSGKNLMSMAVAAQLGTPTLVLVHKSDLASQWHKDAQMFFPGAVLGHVQGDMWRFRGGHVTTALVQTLWARRGNYPKDFINSFGMLVVDEGHRFSADIFEFILKVFPARYRLGVSATWRRSDGLEGAFKNHLGPIISVCEVTSNSGRFIQIPINVPLAGYSSRAHWAILLNMIAANEGYNTWLTEHIFNAGRADRKVLVLSDRIEQLQTLKLKADMKFYNEGVRKTTAMYLGGMDKIELQQAKKCDIILATYAMMSEGSDCPSLDTLIMATPRSDVEQCVGRIQRYHEGKKSLVVIDPVLSYPIFQSIARKRRFWYSKVGFVKADK